MGSHSGLCPALCNPGCGVGQCYTRCCSCPPLFSPGWGLCGAPSTALPVSGPPRGSADGGWAALQEGLDGQMDTWMRGSRAARRGSQPEHGAGATGPPALPLHSTAPPRRHEAQPRGRQRRPRGRERDAVWQKRKKMAAPFVFRAKHSFPAARLPTACSPAGGPAPIPVSVSPAGVKGGGTTLPTG